MKLTTMLILFTLTQTSGQIGSPHKITLDVRPENQLILCATAFYDSSQNVNSEDNWLAQDKVHHFAFSFLWVLAVQYVCVNKLSFAEKEASPISVVTGVSVGLLKEIHDRRKPKGYFSKRDLVADFLGLVVGLAVTMIEASG